jgi:hypothetical protein
LILFVSIFSCSSEGDSDDDTYIAEASYRRSVDLQNLIADLRTSVESLESSTGSPLKITSSSSSVSNSIILSRMLAVSASRGKNSASMQLSLNYQRSAGEEKDVASEQEFE